MIIAANKALIADFISALSGHPKKREAITQFVSDPKLIEHIQQVEAAFPCYEIVCDQMLAENGHVVVRGRFQGTHLGDFAGVEPSGKNITAGLIVIYRIENGKIANHWLQIDSFGLFDDLLAFSRMKKSASPPVTVDIGGLVQSVISEAEHDTAGRAIEWRVFSLPQARGDLEMLRLVMVNLISNAIKYTRPRSPAQIEIGARRHDREIVYFVRDNGVGFDMKQRDRLFGTFQRLHPSVEFEGTGIGLAIVRRIIQHHGGRTWAEGSPGNGSTFYFSLPT